MEHSGGPTNSITKVSYKLIELTQFNNVLPLLTTLLILTIHRLIDTAACRVLVEKTPQLPALSIVALRSVRLIFAQFNAMGSLDTLLGGRQTTC